jgi:hypothetical protein
METRLPPTANVTQRAYMPLEMIIEIQIDQPTFFFFNFFIGIDRFKARENISWRSSRHSIVIDAKLVRQILYPKG